METTADSTSLQSPNHSVVYCGRNEMSGSITKHILYFFINEKGWIVLLMKSAWNDVANITQRQNLHSQFDLNHLSTVLGSALFSSSYFRRLWDSFFAFTPF